MTDPEQLIDSQILVNRYLKEMTPIIIMINIWLLLSDDSKNIKLNM